MEQDTIADMRHAEAARLAAMRANDAEALQGLLAEDLVYLHSGGERDTRASYLAALREGRLEYRPDLDIQETAIEVAGDEARVSARMTGGVLIEGTERRLNSLTLCVWRRADGVWRLARFEAKPPG